MKARPCLRPLAAIAAGAAVIAWLGPAGIALAVVAGLLALVWRFDNWSGSCFMLALLVVIVVAILVLLLALMSLQR